MPGAGDGLKDEGAARVILPVGLGTCFSLLGDSAIYTVLPLHTEAAGITMASVGVLMGVNRLVRLVSNAVAGHLFDRGPRRTLFIGSLVIGALSTLGYALFRGFWPLFLSRSLWGFAWSGISIGGVSILLAVTDAKNRGRWMGVHYLWFVLGNAIGALVGGLQSDLLGFRGAMGVNAGLSLASVVAVALLLPAAHQRPREQAAVSAGGTLRWDAGLYLMSAVLAVNRLVLSGILAGTVSLITRDRLSPCFVFVGASTLTGVVNVARTAVSMIASAATGRISDALKDRWAAVGASLAIGAAGLFLLALDSPVSLVAGLLLCAIPASGITVLARALVGDLASPRYRGKAMAVVQTVGDLGSAAGPPLAFLLLPVVGLAVVFRAASLLFVLQMLVIAALRGPLGSRGR